MSIKKANSILVLGANGKTGSRIVKLLNEQGAPVRSGSRSAEIPFDWQKTDTWSPALTNINAVYLTFQPDLAVPEAVDLIRQFCQLALDKGIRRIVLLSGRGEKEAMDCEDVLKSIIPDWTIVRASWFFENFSESFFLEPIQQGNVTLPVSGVKEPFISADDIAEIVVKALTSNDHVQKLYEVTGDRLLTFPEAIAEIAKASKREIIFQSVNHEEYTSMLNDFGVPADYVWLLSYLFTQVLDGRNSSVTSTVEEVLGRKPRSFSNYVTDTAARGVWK